MIRLLSEQTINQIAAGEVIENPASVVKELIENSLDAGASSIKVETQGGGRGLIRITDNGQGMDSDDLLMSLERHATSKISDVNDLETLHSLGFRGEALPSIAAVSKMRLESSLGERGHQLEVIGGKIGQLTPAARQIGTTIEVRSLFFNVPVRKKFQKSVGADVAEIHKCLARTALAGHDLALTWVHEGKVQFALTKDMTLLERIQEVLGEEYANNLIEVEGLGYVAKAVAHRPNRTGQYLAINQRPVTSPFISQKVLEAYSTRLPARRFPLFVLGLTLPPDWIDVNVHPQKREVRLREQAKIGESLIDGVERALRGKTVPLKEIHFESTPFETSVSEEVVTYTPEVKEESLPLFAPQKEVLAIWGDFILTQEDEGLQLYDAKAICYTLEFDNLEKRTVEQQTLLFPHPIEVTRAEAMFLMEHLEKINELGVAIRPFGEHTFVVDALPIFLEVEEIGCLLTSFLEGDFVRSLARRSKVRLTSTAQAARLLERIEGYEQTPEGKPLAITITEDEVRRRFESDRNSTKSTR